MARQMAKRAVPAKPALLERRGRRQSRAWPATFRFGAISVAHFENYRSWDDPKTLDAFPEGRVPALSERISQQVFSFHSAQPFFGQTQTHHRDILQHGHR